jgi:ion channel-forming bestrophin family protein
LKEIFHRHFAWLTALRLNLREPKTWENTYELGNAKILAELPAPESQSVFNDEIAVYFSDPELQKVIAYRGDKEALILNLQYQALGDVRKKALISDTIFVSLTNALDEFVRLQSAAKRIKNYPYARNHYSIAIILVKAFVGIVPFALFPYAHELGRSAGIEHWTA